MSLLVKTNKKIQKKFFKHSKYWLESFEIKFVFTYFDL